MGRPKGSKNKPKIPPTGDTLEITTEPKKSAATKKEPKAAVPQQHIALQFADYVLERMNGMELEWYRRFATKNNTTLKHAVVKATIDLFRIQDQALLDLLTKEHK